MTKHEGYDTVRPMFTRGKLQAFSDIFKLVPKTVVATDLGKEKGRFNQLVENPGDFTLQEIMKLSDHCSLSLPEMAVLIEAEYPGGAKDSPRQKAYEYEVIRPMFEEKKINLFEDIFRYIAKSTVATDISKKRDRFTHLMNHVEDFFVKDIRAIGELCELTLPEMFQLVEAQYARQKNK